MSKNDESTKKLTAKQRRAIASLVAGDTQEQAAVSAGVSPKTVWRWLAYDVNFAAAI